MIQSIQASPTLQALTTQATQRTQAESATGFANLLEQALQPVREADTAAKSESLGLLTGETTSIHQVVLAAEKADLALQLTLQIRNKAMDAYNEIMRMQL